MNFGAVIEMDEVRDLVGDDVAAHRRRREDQPPAQAGSAPRDEQLPHRLAASPTPTVGGERDAGRRGIIRRPRSDMVSSARFLRKRFDPAGEPVGTGRRRRSSPPAQPRRARRALRAQACERREPSIGMTAPGSNRIERFGAGKLLIGIHSACSSIQASAARRLVRHGQVSLSMPVHVIEAQPHAARIAHRPNLDRQVGARPRAPLQRGRSTT